MVELSIRREIKKNRQIFFFFLFNISKSNFKKQIKVINRYDYIIFQL